MSYDIAAKVLIDKCRGAILRRLLGIPVAESTLLEEVPQETATLRRSDFPLLVTQEDGRQKQVIIEIQSRWQPDVPLRVLEYRCRHKLKKPIETISCVLLLRPSTVATDVFEEEEVRFHFRLIRVYELQAVQFVQEGTVCLLPLVPLIRGGLELTDQADRLIYESDLSTSDKAEMLTSLAILSGLVSKELPAELIARRRDIMIESVAYELIKQEGIQEGLQRGHQKGLQQGRQEGLLDGIALGLELRFGPAGLKLLSEINRIQDLPTLRAIASALRVAQTLDELREIYEGSLPGRPAADDKG